MGGSDLSVVSRIIGLADAFDVMCSSRVYHEPARWGEAVAGISAEAGRQFDPDIVDVFKACSDNLREKFESQPLQDT